MDLVKEVSAGSTMVTVTEAEVVKVVPPTHTLKVLPRVLLF